MAVTINYFNSFIQDLGLARMNLNSDTFKVILVNSYTFNASHASKSQITGELSTGAGYTAGGATLAQTWTNSGATNKFDADDISWLVPVSQTLGPCTGAVIYDDTVTSPTADRLMCYIDFGSTETVAEATELKIIFDTNGIFTIG